MDVALSLDQFSTVEWPEHPIAADFQERLPEVARILFLEPGREGSLRLQNRPVTVRLEDSLGIAFSCEYFKPRICDVQDKSTFNACGGKKVRGPIRRERPVPRPEVSFLAANETSTQYRLMPIFIATLFQRPMTAVVL